jgi:hypothetical protein
MAAEMPVRVQPVAGAVVVDFPWSEASTAVTALNDAVTALGTQLEARATLAPTIVDWAGTYRNEFNGADNRLTTTATGLRETLAAVASWIVGGAESANQAQRDRNTEAEQGITTGAPSPARRGRNIPV